MEPPESSEGAVPAERSLLELVQEEDAQAAVEYVIIVAMIIIGAASVFGLFPRAIREYYEQVALVLSLPIP